jgi:hypothetical protein
MIDVEPEMLANSNLALSTLSSPAYPDSQVTKALKVVESALKMCATSARENSR